MLSDDPADPSEPPLRPLDDFLMALRFFSRLPSGNRPHEVPDLSRIARALPLASLVIGLLPALVLGGGVAVGLPTLFAAALAVAIVVVSTGAMAEDALADAADGLFGGSTIERRLEIMKDSRHGTYGVAALCLSLLLRVTALAAMASVSPLGAALVWLAIIVMSRSGGLWLAVALPPARNTGASASAGRPTQQSFGIGIAMALLLGLILSALAGQVSGFLGAAALMTAVAYGWTDLCRRLAGGQTGDLIGAAQALLEIAGLTAFLLLR